MGRFVEDIEQNMSVLEFMEWELFYSIEPFGELRADLRSAHEMQQQGNIHRNSKTKKAPWRLKDFIMSFGETKGNIEKEESTEARQKKIDDDINRVFSCFKKPEE